MSGHTTEPASLAEHGAVQERTAWLSVVHTPDASSLGKRMPLDEGLLLVGRDIDAHGLCVDDLRLSRIHARFTLDARAGMFRVGDAQSRNGTFVNGARVETQLLSHGDVVRAGDSVFVYCEHDALEGARKRAELLARSTLNVLVLGETGTGKEVFAKQLHAQSGREGPLVAVNCASIPGELMAAELFGHTKSAFSGAQQARKGLFAAAEHGTLLLDEVGDCPLDVQAALLRAIQEKAVRPIGSEREQSVDVRVIAATHQDLDAAVKAGSFRADLFARLSQATIELPPLRARKAELLELARDLAVQAAQALVLTADAAEALLLWSWPMNVRELQSLTARFCALRPGAALDLTALADVAPVLAAPILARKRGVDSSQPVGSTLPPPPGAAVGEGRSQLRALLEQSGGNVSAVAEQLGKPRAQVYRWMKSMGLTAEKFRRG